MHIQLYKSATPLKLNLYTAAGYMKFVFILYNAPSTLLANDNKIEASLTFASCNNSQKARCYCSINLFVPPVLM